MIAMKWTRFIPSVAMCGATLSLVACSTGTPAQPDPSSPGQSPTATGVQSSQTLADQERRNEPTGDDQVIHARYLAYDTAEEVLDASMLSVVGRVTASREEVGDLLDEPGAQHNPNDPRPLILPYTVYTMQVDSVLKGDVEPGDAIEFRILGGSHDGQRYVLAGAPLLSVNSGQVILANLAGEGKYPGPINLREGVLQMSGGELKSLTGTDLSEREMLVLEDSVYRAWDE
ncbi:MAG: hypothetical protein Q4G34_04875 [Micrococcus sp.]|nr:hypothetical protein [Micrococcus sp.]